MDMEFWTLYLIAALLWTAYRAVETYRFERPQSRPHPVGFFVSETLLVPISVAVELMPGGTLRERIRDAYRIARRRNQKFERTGPKKLIG